MISSYVLLVSIALIGRFDYDMVDECRFVDRVSARAEWRMTYGNALNWCSENNAIMGLARFCRGREETDALFRKQFSISLGSRHFDMNTRTFVYTRFETLEKDPK
jgi:hypothetical protein